MVRIPFRMVGIAFECFESRSNASNLHLNSFRMVGFCIQMLRILFEWFKFSFEWLESLGMVRICVQMFLIICSNLHSNSHFEWFEFVLECFESRSNGSNLHSNGSNPVRIVWICIRMVRIPFEWFKFPFGCFNSRSNGLNLVWNS